MAKIEFELVKSAERLGHIANEILDSPVTGLDIETTGFKLDQKDSKPSPFRDDIRLMSINTGKSVYVIDHYETKTLEPVVRALEETKGIKLASNAKYEQSWLLSQYNAELWPLFDPFRASALLTNGKKLPNDLYSMYERYLKIAPPTKDLGASDWSLPLSPEQYEYSASDVTYLHQLRDVLKPQLAKQGLNRVALIEFGAILPESAVELNGFPIDSEAWLALAAENQAKAAELHKKLVWNLPNPKAQQTLFGFEPDLNLNSPPQMLASLRKLGIKQQCEECRGKGVTRYREACGICQGTGIVELQNTREMTIAMFAAEFPIVKELIEYRGYDKSVSTYGPEWLRWIDPTTGRLHSSFWPFTEAGRYSSGKPNLQNLPRDKRFRRCFKAPNGKRFRLGDYSNIEMRIIAELSQDPRLLQIFRNGEDAHYVTAATLVGRAISEVTAHERQQAKPVNFGFCLTPGTTVVTDVGLKKIEDMAVGDMVWTHKSRWRRVEATQVADAEAILKITTKSGKIVECTPDHGWMTFDPKREEIYKWVKAEELVVGTDLCFHSDTLWPGTLSIGKDLARMIGWFISEGSWGKKTGFRIKQDREANPGTVEQMREILIGKLGFREWKDASTCSTFYLPAARVGAVVESCGVDLSLKSANKRIPERLQNLTVEERLELIAGLWDGDGTIVDTGHSLNVFYYSTSLGMLEDLRKLLDSVGINSKVYGRAKGRTVASLAVIGALGQRKFLKIVPTSKAIGKDRISKTQHDFCEKIVTIELITYAGKVHDITVEEDHSFVANSLISLNCYGMMPPKMVLYAMANYGVALSLKQSTEFRSKFFELYSRLPSWHRELLDAGERTHFMKNKAGRIRYLNDDAHNEYLNSPVQSLGAEGLKASLRNVYMRLKKFGGWNGQAKMINHIHDEIITEIDDDDELDREVDKELKAGMHEGMAQFLDSVPVVVETKSGPSWGAK